MINFNPLCSKHLTSVETVRSNCCWEVQRGQAGFLQQCRDKLTLFTRKETSSYFTFTAKFTRRHQWCRIRPSWFTKIFMFLLMVQTPKNHTICSGINGYLKQSAFINVCSYHWQVKRAQRCHLHYSRPSGNQTAFNTLWLSLWLQGGRQLGRRSFRPRTRVCTHRWQNVVTCVPDHLWMWMCFLRCRFVVHQSSSFLLSASLTLLWGPGRGSAAPAYRRVVLVHIEYFNSLSK